MSARRATAATGDSARARPNSTMRAVPIGSDPAMVCRNGSSPHIWSTSLTASRRRRSIRLRGGKATRSARMPPPPPCHSVAVSRFSSTVRRPKTCWRWKVRRMPARERATAECPVMSFPSKKIEPVPGSRNPDTTSKNVVFPAPLGPISPRTSPRCTSMETSRSAMTPEKDTPTPCTWRPVPGVGAAPGVTDASICVIARHRPPSLVSRTSVSLSPCPLPSRRPLAL